MTSLASSTPPTVDRPGTLQAPIPTAAPPGGWWGRTGLRLWHRVLSAGTGDVAQFRGWYRLIQWRGARSVGDRLGAIKTLLMLPARAARQAYQDVRAVGDELEEKTGVS